MRPPELACSKLMRRHYTPPSADDLVKQQLRGLPRPAPGVLSERREPDDRRRRAIWSVLYGNFQPRRRQTRRQSEARFHSVDWHSSHLLGAAICILLLCAADAFLTLILLSQGANEANPVMARVVYGDVTIFTSIKLAMTAMGVVTMVLLARHRLFRIVRVQAILYLILLGYACLIGYEILLLKGIDDIDLPIF
jgi:Domain of unknown function (DUF5658)